MSISPNKALPVGRSARTSLRAAEARRCEQRENDQHTDSKCQ